MTPSADIVLRPLEPTDGSALVNMFEQTPDAGQITFSERFKVDAYTALTALHPDTAGVLAVLRATGQIVGIAMVDISHRHIEGQVRPCALLNTLKVHPNYRRQGIAGQLAQWRIDYARQRLGQEVVILADIQKSNVASQQPPDAGAISLSANQRPCWYRCATHPDITSWYHAAPCQAR